MTSRWCWLTATLLIAGCQPVIKEPSAPPKAETGLPDQAYWDIAETQPVYRIDSAESRVELVARRAGPLAKLGHDHVIEAVDVEGYVLVANSHPKDSRADMRIDLQSLIVDAPAARERHSLESTPSPDAIHDTTGNLQQKLLETSRWPFSRIHIDSCRTADRGLICSAEFVVKGMTHRQNVSFDINVTTDQLSATGELDLLQTDLGIEPFSVGAGTLSVDNRVEASFVLKGQRL